MASFAESNHICSQSKHLTCEQGATFNSLGKVSSDIQVYNYSYNFGESQREAKRVIFLNASGQLIGIYAVPEAASGIKDHCVMFPFKDTIGNSICLHQGQPPKTVWLDGENFELFM